MSFARVPYISLVSHPTVKHRFDWDARIARHVTRELSDAYEANGLKRENACVQNTH
jgi:hypothetical protein